MLPPRADEPPSSGPSTSTNTQPMPVPGARPEATAGAPDEPTPREAELARRVAELERRVEERDAELADLYDNAPCGYHSLGADGTILRMNQTELGWLGYQRDEVVGKLRWPDLLTESSKQFFARAFPKFLETGWQSEAEIELVRRDGTTMPVVVHAVGIRDASGRIATTRSTSFDNTTRHAMEQQLRQANVALEIASRTKDEFLASMSHELRSPLHAVLGNVELLDQHVYGEINERQRAALRCVDESGRHLLALINDILDLAKVEAGKASLELGPIDVEDLAAASLRLVRDAALRRGVALKLVVPFGVPPVLVDERRLKQVLVNLLSNAVKFTERGGSVTLEACAHAAAERLDFTVSDTGIGIAEGDLPRLFQPFVQLDSSLARKHTGTGLGLALVRRLVEMHGGEVRVESRLGEGSRFTVTLPLRRAPKPAPVVEPPPPPPPPPTAGRRRRVLLVDDEPLNLGTVSEYLMTRGYEVHLARDGHEAVQSARDLRPDVILMDIQMPAMDGLAATRVLRADVDERVRRVPIIAVTALAMSGDRERCLAAGADRYLAKPVSLRRLASTIDELVPG